MNIYKITLYEMKKLIRHKEIYIALFLCTIIYMLGMKAFLDENEPYMFWRSVLDVIPYIGYWFIAIIVIVGVSRMIPFDREQRVADLLITYPKGRIHLLLSKQLALFLYCVTIAFYFWGLSFVYYSMHYDIAGASVSNAVLPPIYTYVDSQIPYLELLLYEFIYTVMASYILALCVMCLSLFIKRSVMIMLIMGALFAIGEFYDKYGLRYLSTVEWANWLRYLYDYGLNGILSFRYLRIPRYGVETASIGNALLFFTLVSCLLILLNLWIGRKRVYANVGN